MPAATPRAIERTLLRLLAERAGKTICPSEVARALSAASFQPLMPAVRAVAARLLDCGVVTVTQRGRPVDPRTVRGPIRLAFAAGPPPRSRALRAADRKRVSPYHGVDFRHHPEAYRVGRGEQGVLSAEPYKSELLPLWRFRTPQIARRSAIAIWNAFVGYRRVRDFVGMDMARKFLQMGFTRARRYANHASGRKYERGGAALPREEDAGKALAAEEFRVRWQRAEGDPTYRMWRKEQRARVRT